MKQLNHDLTSFFHDIVLCFDHEFFLPYYGDLIFYLI